MRRELCRLPVGAVIVVACLWAAPAAFADTSFTVDDTTTDAPLANPADTACVSSSTDATKCTLRAAIQAADNVGGASTITLPAGTITLSMGEIDINQPGAAAAPVITLTGTGADTTIIDAGMVSRVFAIASGSSLSIASVAITHGDEPNMTTGDGGAIQNSGALTITDSELYGNTAGHEGGALYSTGSAAVTISGSTFVGNQAGFAGGAVTAVGSGAYTLTNDTFDHNDGGDSGGGALAYLQPTGSSLIQNVTIARNNSSSGSAILFPYDAGTIENTIIAGNTGSASCNAAIDAGADGGGNVSDDSSCFPPSVAGDKLGVDAKLGPLQDNGGPSETDALLLGSPAIWNVTAMNCPVTDQRGIHRLAANCDSGAYQGREADIGLTASGTSTATTGNNATDTFTVTNDGPYAADVTFTDPLPAGASFTGVSTTLGSCSGGGTVTCSIALPAGASATITITFTAGQPGQLDNQATVSTELDTGSHSDSAGVTTTFSRPVTVIPGGAPANTVRPSIAGAQFAGEPEAANRGTWTNSPASFAYQWSGCTSPSDCTDIKGATEPTYVISDDLLDQSLRVTVTATGAGGRGSATSDLTPPVIAAVDGGTSDAGTSGESADFFYTCRVPGTGETNLACLLVVILTGSAPIGHPTQASAKTTPVVVGSKKVTVKRGKKAKIKIKLNAKGRKLLAKEKKLKVTMTITQKHGKTITKKLTFKAPRKAHKH